MRNLPEDLTSFSGHTQIGRREAHKIFDNVPPAPRHPQMPWHNRTAEGRSRAKARSKQMGRPLPSRRNSGLRPGSDELRGAKFKELAISYDVGIATISRLCI
jgi:hypothetical protein